MRACCRNFILQEDIEHFLPPDAAKLCFESLDIDGDGKVSLHDMREAVLKIYQNRKHLALTLKDTRTIVGKLERLVGSIIHFVWIFIYLSIWNVSCAACLYSCLWRPRLKTKILNLLSSTPMAAAPSCKSVAQCFSNFCPYCSSMLSWGSADPVAAQVLLHMTQHAVTCHLATWHPLNSFSEQKHPLKLSFVHQTSFCRSKILKGCWVSSLGVLS